MPDTTLATLQEFGASVAIYEDYVAIGSSSNDSIKYQGGIVFIYKKNVGLYEKVATIFPRGDDNYSDFGYAIDLNDNYLVATALGNNSSFEEDVEPKFYIFERPVEGWKDNVTEISHSGYGGSLFGIQVHITEDSENILVGNLETSEGSVFSFRVGPAGWETGLTRQEIKADPKYLLETENIDFGGTFTYYDQYIAVGGPLSYYNERWGGIFLYKDEVGDGLNYESIALLQGKKEDSYFLGAIRMAMDEQFIYSSVFEDGEVFFIAYPKGIDWNDNYSAIQIPYSEDTLFVTVREMEAIGDEIFVTALSKDSTENIFIFDRDSIGKESYYPKRIIVNEGVQSSGFGTDLDAFGSDLIVGNNRFEDFNYSNGVAELYETFPDTVIQSNIFKETFYDATDHYFGQNLYFVNNHLLVGTPNDSESGTEFGAVYIYSKAGDVWQEESKIVPPGNDRYDDYFGSAISSSKDDFVIGAAGFEPGGKVFTYKNTSPSGVDLAPQKVIEPPDTMEVRLFGSSVAIEDDLLVVSAHEQSGTVKNALFIYERDASQDWQLQEVLLLSNVSPLNKGAVLSVDIYNQQILVGNSSSRAGELLTKEPSDGSWKIISEFTHPRPSHLHGFATSTKITENHIFINAPNINIGDAKSVGAIYVYTKPAQGWPSYTSSAQQIVPYDTLEYGLFGYSFEVIENTIIAGAPMADYKYVGTKFTLIDEPGAAYVIQGVDYNWEETIPFLKLQGESLSESDQYGFSVGLSEDHFFIGATMEDTEKGHNSGAVYATNMPPLIKVVPPVCFDDEKVDLFGYPYGGTWSGPGITDADVGMFDPLAAGVGEHLLTYETPNCAYTGKLKIVVHANPVILSTSPAKMMLCKAVPARLSVDAEEAIAYKWHFKPEYETSFLPLIGSSQATWETLEPGSYYCEVIGHGCSVATPVFVVEKMSAINLIASSNVICQNDFVTISPNAPVDGENLIWYFKEPASQSFIEIGEHEVLTTSRGGDYTMLIPGASCSFHSDTITLVDKTLAIKIETPEVVCSKDQQIYLKGYPAGGVWTGTGVLDGHQGIFDGTALGNGTYSVTYTIEDETCSYTLSTNVTIEVGAPLTLKFMEEKICLPHKSRLGVENGEQFHNLEWYYLNGEEPILVAANVLELEIQDFGTYYTTGKLHNCQIYSDTVKFEAKPHNIFIPNVFTPNGDPFNEDFQIIGENMEDFYLQIINRWGKVIFETREKEHRWKAEDSPSGVYYYSINYKDCFNKHQVLTGALTVIK